MPKRPFQSLSWPLSAHQIEVLNSMLENLFKKSNTAASSEITGILEVAKGGSGRASAIPWAVILGGITTTGQHQSVSDLGTAGQVLTSNGAGMSPSWQDTSGVQSLDDLDDVVITTPADGDALVFNGTNWVNQPANTVYYEWSVLTNGDPGTPELIFAGGDVIMIRVP